MDAIHTPVLLEECLIFLAPDEADGGRSAFMVDATLGEGGHTETFLRRYDGLSVAGVDADADILERAKLRLSEFAGRVMFFNEWSDAFFQSIQRSFPPLILYLWTLEYRFFITKSQGGAFRSATLSRLICALTCPFQRRLHLL